MDSTFDEVDDSCSMDSCSTIAQPEDDRGYRKKSREKMRRQEVNVKVRFESLAALFRYCEERLTRCFPPCAV